jgi:hypothetical protein
MLGKLRLGIYIGNTILALDALLPLGLSHHAALYKAKQAGRNCYALDIIASTS